MLGSGDSETQEVPSQDQDTLEVTLASPLLPTLEAGSAHQAWSTAPQVAESGFRRRNVRLFKPTLLSPLRKVTELVFYPIIRG